MSEKNLDFDTVIDRKNTRSIKFDSAIKHGLPEDVLPLWVADMDFRTSSYIEEALAKRALVGIYGYSDIDEAYFDAVKGWMKKYHNWDVKKGWLLKTPGVVCAIAMAIKAYTNKGDNVMLQLPVYYPFSEVIKDNGRNVISSDLVLKDDGKYVMDYEDIEEKIVKYNIKLFLLCNPHNPVGRVWSAEELEKLGDICVKHQVYVVSDEIHSDLIFKGHHTVFANIKKEFEDISITCTSPSKTFNLASLMLSNIFIPNRILRKAFADELKASSINQVSIFGIIACETAYTKGHEWYEALLSYIKKNIEFAKDYVNKNLKGVKVIELEGTYLLWLDFRDLNFSVGELENLIINEAKLWLDSGKMFGKPGEGFQRINLACPRKTLTEALTRLKKALDNY
ncbi:cystathione beta-lyase [Acetitomaculum ruminis DSM 5522]|uniref:cysteine-S-conjugate beta-lyase n=1 Tax=Acetitomaculum ruminis DSM 5522 TaxID=1120918 RepID=A0A1I0W6K6_9FIRM|nr:MalY/PatB family protein [Acetitomaculum ruminis]SFA83556.1 cystathione beta-lyase [Acetitomaculum ruminis DSM 5522]